MGTLIYTVAESDSDLYGILRLQRENLAISISQAEALEQGFVTVEHDFALLKRMNMPYPHIIAKDGDEIVGYTLVMMPDLRDEIPLLTPMFEQIDTIRDHGQLLKDTRYIVMGQVCVAKRYRGQGVFQGLYQEFARRMSIDFDDIITEISLRNPRSLQAHLSVGFEIINVYQAEDGEEWAIVLWRITERR